MENRCAQLMKQMTDNPEEAIEAARYMREEQKKKKCIYEGNTFDISLAPLIITTEEYEFISDVSQRLYSIINKVIKNSIHDKKIQTYLTYKEVPPEWMEIDYKEHAVITRLDALFDGKNLKFLEFNTDNPGGKGWNDIFEEVMISLNIYREIIPSYHNKKTVADGLFQASIKSFEDFFSEGKEPAVAFIEYKDSPFIGDPEIVRDYFNLKGIKASLIDPRDFEYDGTVLKSNGEEYNIIIRCIKSQEFFDYPEELKAIISAYLDGKVCMINTFRALTGSEKTLLALLWNRDFHHYFTDEEIETIKNHIPPTFRMNSKKVISYDEKEVSLKEYLLKEKENFVLKPSWGYGGHGVILGRHVSFEKWKEKVIEYSGNAAWVAQEYVEIPKMDIPVIKENKRIEIERKYFNINPYVFGGKYVGSLGRISDLPIINIASGGGILPVFVK